MSRIRTTHTVAELEVSAAVYSEVAKLLREAGYDHVFQDGMIDMTGIGLVRAARPEVPPGGSVNGCWIHDQYTKGCWMCGDPEASARRAKLGEPGGSQQP